MFAAGRHGRSISTPPRCTPPPGCCWPQTGAEEDLLPTSPTAIERSTCSRTSQPRSSPAPDRSRTSAPTRVAECTSWISSADASSPLAPGSRRACYRRAPTSLGIEVQLGYLRSASSRGRRWAGRARSRTTSPIRLQPTPNCAHLVAGTDEGVRQRLAVRKVYEQQVPLWSEEPAPVDATLL